MARTSDYDFHLPSERIAQTPVEPRDASRLLVLHRQDGRLEHRRFADLPHYLRPNDLLFANDSRVLPARLYGRKATSGGRVELLLLKRLAERQWQVLAGGKRLRVGTIVHIHDHADQPSPLAATITAAEAGALRVVTFNQPLTPALADLGHVPLPPYIQTPLADPDRYQTVYARPAGSAAAPTAGLHFTPELLLALRQQGIAFETGTLHVGLDTFLPVSAEQVADHTIHTEWLELRPAAARRINEAKLAGGRLVAVGTTAVRLLETAALRSAGERDTLQAISAAPPPAACPWRAVTAVSGPTDFFIYPGYQFRAVDALITNFHLPRSSLLMLVSAFAGRERILAAYETAVREHYRFYSFGDAMLIL